MSCLKIVSLTPTYIPEKTILALDKCKLSDSEISYLWHQAINWILLAKNHCNPTAGMVVFMTVNQLKKIKNKKNQHLILNLEICKCK